MILLKKRPQDLCISFIDLSNVEISSRPLEIKEVDQTEIIELVSHLSGQLQCRYPKQ